MDTSLRVKRRHRSWPEMLKREIVSASFAPGASVSIVARQYNVNSNQVFAWRKRFGETSLATSSPQFVPVMVTPDEPARDGAGVASDVIEIDLPHGYRVRVPGGVKAATLRLVLDTLERR
ncbi:IS66-like element accessory protein TnpA [Acidisphaera sp. L21]|uniref:IS66-like element accessory protein TnpA n=1 Tax=Acidisphaera sp. L21 TaxID=1641851 RepID=UPI0038D1926D